jgi:hypothetical protein
VHSRVYHPEVRKWFVSTCINSTILGYLIIGGSIAIRWLLRDGTPDKPLIVVAPWIFALILVFLPVGIALLLTPFLLFFRRAHITITQETISALNSWGARRTIPLSDLLELKFRENPYASSWALKSRSHGTVYILEQTENIESLLAQLRNHIPAELETNSH